MIRRSGTGTGVARQTDFEAMALCYTFVVYFHILGALTQRSSPGSIQCGLR
jgi:hypothetical protein